MFKHWVLGKYVLVTQFDYASAARILCPIRVLYHNGVKYYNSVFGMEWKSLAPFHTFSRIFKHNILEKLMLLSIHIY